MGQSFWARREESPHVLLKGLKRLGLSVGSGARHDYAVIPSNGAKTMIPRHRPVSKQVVESICKFLLTNGYTEQEIKKSFKWK